MNQSDKTRLLEQIAAIPTMERGKLSRYVFNERSDDAPPHFKLQRWQDGKNHTRHVSADELPAVQSALAGYAQYQELTERYAERVIQETRQNIAGAKKKNRHRPPSASRKKKKSSN